MVVVVWDKKNQLVGFTSNFLATRRITVMIESSMEGRDKEYGEAEGSPFLCFYG